MALFRGIQEYIALDANNIILVFDSGNIVNIFGNIFLYPPQGHPILYNYRGFMNFKWLDVTEYLNDYVRHRIVIIIDIHSHLNPFYISCEYQCVR